MKHLISVLLLCSLATLVRADASFALLSGSVPTSSPTWLFSSTLVYADQTAATAAGLTGAGTPTWNYTTAPAPLLGLASSLQINATGDAVSTILSADQTDLWAYIAVKQTSVSSAGFLMSFRDSGNVEIAAGSVLATGTLKALVGAGVNTTAGVEFVPTTLTADPPYHFWFHYYVSGANATLDFYKSTDGVRPASPVVTKTVAQTTAIHAIYLKDGGSTVVILNNLIISASAIGDNSTP